jgi:4,5-dihydroxyphthalate decarboxylase
MLKINLACWDYDRTRPIHDHRVKVEGMEVNYIPLWVEEIFPRMLRSKEFDVPEMSLSG